MKKFIAAICFTFICACVFAQVEAFEKNLYQDPNGFFSVLKPDGWRTSEYNETGRGKVKFIHPANDKIKVIIIGEPNPYSSFNELVEASKNSDQRMKEKYQSYDVSVTSETFTADNIQYTKSIMTLKKMDIKQLLVDFILKNMHFSFSYAAPISSFDAYVPKIFESVFSLIPSNREFTDQEIKNALVTSKIKQAQYNLQMGLNDYAIKYIDEGLAIDPTNQKLIELKNEINK